MQATGGGKGCGHLDLSHRPEKEHYLIDTGLLGIVPPNSVFPVHMFVYAY